MRRVAGGYAADVSARRSSIGSLKTTSSYTDANGVISVTPTGTEPFAHAFDEPLWRRCARRQADGLDVLEPALVDVGLVVDQVSRDSGLTRHLDEPVRVGRVGRADHEEQVDLREQLLHRPLAIGGRVADVLALRPADLREAALQHLDDLRGLVDRERGLRDVGERRVLRQCQPLGVLDGLDERDRLRRLADRADDLLVAGMTDQHDPHPVGRIPSRLYVHLRDERARRVDRGLVASRGAVVDHGCHAVRREDDDRPVRSVRLILDEDRASPLEVADDVRVVDDLLAHVHGCAIKGKRPLHRLDGAFDSGTVTPGRGKQNPLDQTVGHGSTVPSGPPGDTAR